MFVLTIDTCAYEHDIVLAIFCFNLINHYLGELVVHICSDNDGSMVNWVDWIEHGWVTSGKSDYFIWKIFGRIKSTKCLAWTLERKGSHLITFFKKMYKA